MSILLGTCSWTDKPLIETGRFYLPDAKSPEARLRFYSSIFPTVEVDSSYYGIPTVQTVTQWAERTPPDFVFHIKAFRLMTSDPAKVKELLAANERKEVSRREKELRRIQRRLAELDADFNRNLDLLKRGILNEAEFVKADEARREEYSRLEAQKTEMETWLGQERQRAEAVGTLPLRVRSFLQDFESLDIRRAKAQLQTILKAAHVYRDGRIELEFRT